MPEKTKKSKLPIIIIIVTIILAGLSILPNLKEINLININAKDKTKILRYAKYESGEEVICWEGGCGWTSVPPYKTISNIANNPAAVPSVISQTPPTPVIEELEIGRYQNLTEETYSPLKAAVIGEKYIFYTLKEKDGFNLYQFDRQKKKTKLIFQKFAKDSKPYPLKINPANPDELTVAVYQDKTVSFEIFNVKQKTSSGAKEYTQLQW